MKTSFRSTLSPFWLVLLSTNIWMGWISCNPDTKGSRHLDQYAIEIVGLNTEGKRLTGEMSAEVESTVDLQDSTRQIAMPSRQGSYFIVFPPRATREAIKTLKLQIGDLTAEVDYSAQDKESYTPEPELRKGMNTRGMCEYQDNAPHGSVFIEYAWNRLVNALEPKAYAFSYEYECQVTFRERDKITVTFR